MDTIFISHSLEINAIHTSVVVQKYCRILFKKNTLIKSTESEIQFIYSFREI